MRKLVAVLFWVFMAGGVAAQEFGLDAPQTAGIRESVEVTWTAPDARKGLIEIRPDGGAGKRVSYAYLQNNPQRIEAPEVPGDYALVLVYDREIRVSKPLAVEPVSASLSAVERADAGADIVVAWQGPNNRQDLVTMAAPGGAPIRGTGYAYVGNSSNGTVRIRMPKDAGQYDIVYVTGKTVLARHRIAVGQIAATLDVSPEVPAGSSVEVGFEGPENGGDQITFARRDGDPIKPASYAYVGNARNGVVTLRAFEESGGYDVVYLSGGRVIGRSPVEIVPVTIGIDAPAELPALTRFTVEWRGTGNQGDRIVMLAPGTGAEAAYRYVDPLERNVAMLAPEEPGDYDLVYVTRGGREMARRAITVTPAPVAPGEIEVLAGAAFGPDDAVEVILDASGSMLQRQGGERRIEIAKRTLADLVQRTIPAGTPFAMRVFGNREADACRTDLEIPLAPHDPARALEVISKLGAVNLARTPIARSIALTEQDLAGVGGERVIILVTDGEETCDGDPAAEIEALRRAGVDVRVNIVGYAIDDADLARRFEAWAAAGAGVYLDAADGAQLGAALIRAAAAPFEIVDASGRIVGAGVAGDPPIRIAPGDYTLRLGAGQIAATVVSNERTRIAP